MSRLEALKQELRPGAVYRREDLALLSTAVDRHLKQLAEDGTLHKMAGGLYACLKQSPFGKVPVEDQDLARAFLKTDDFLLFSPNLYTTLGLGATQQYNETWVYNHKRHGEFSFGKRKLRFFMKPYFPKELTKEFLLVDFLNHLRDLPEDENTVMESLYRKIETFDHDKVAEAAARYGFVRTKKLVKELFSLPSSTLTNPYIEQIRGDNDRNDSRIFTSS